MTRSPSGWRWPLVLSRLGLGLLTTVALFLAFAATTFAVTPWSIAATPTTLPVGQATAVSITVVSGSPDITCVQIAIPGGVQVLDAVVASPSGWVVSVQRSNPSTVATFCTGSKNLAPGVSAVLSITVVPSTSAPETWSASAYHDQVPGKLVGPPVAPLPTFNRATPTATPRSTTTLAPGSTPIPTLAPGSTPVPTPNPGSTPVPTPNPGSTPVPTPNPSLSADPTASLGPSDGEQTVPIPTPQPAAEPTASPSLAGSGFTIPRPGGEIRGAFATLGPISWGDLLRWFVPAFAISVPGLLLILGIAIQLVGGGLFVPITRTALLGSGSRRKTRPAKVGRPHN
jgi:hypothetical protein